VAGHALQQQGAILDGARERAGLVERAGKGHDAPARAAAVGRLQADDAAEGRWLADRSYPLVVATQALSARGKRESQVHEAKPVSD
jgi:predicted ATPase